jgi:preprotein translocase subunit SecA
MLQTEGWLPQVVRIDPFFRQTYTSTRVADRFDCRLDGRPLPVSAAQAAACLLFGVFKVSTTKDVLRTQKPVVAAPPAEDLSIWEKLGDALNSFTEGVVQFLTNIWGSSNERLIKDLGYVRLKNADPPYRIIPGSLLARINDLEESFKALSDDELRQTTPKLREQLKKGATLDDLLPEAFAACREAARRFKNMRHYDVQLIGGIVLHQGKIAEMVTGEGKTLVATLPAFLNALEGKGVHIVTVNDYLARRDCEWMTPIYQGLGMTAGYIQADMDPAARRAAYDCDITYGTNSEFGFDYLRDNMKPARWGDPHYPVWMQQCQKALHYAIIDEVDNILIDEARTPLIISGQAHGDVNRYRVADRIARQLKPGIHFEIKEKEQTCHLTEEGIHEAERLAGVESFYTAGNMEWPHLIDQALKAHHLYKRDKRYMVMPHPETGEMSVIIVDEFTGRPMFGRQWSDGLHQAIEAKEGVPIKEETQTLATITLQNFFKLYKKLAGMTGTAMTEANEFWKIYKLEVVAIPTNRPLQRINFPDVVYRTEREKWNAIVDEIAQVHATGRPILVGTVDVARSEKLGEMLKRRGIKFELLNAKPEHVAREAEIIAQAGRLGAVTISTNMAGRGTDIILGGNPEYLAWAKLKHQYPSRLDVPPDVWKRTVDEVEAREQTRDEGRKVAALGGLHVIGTERHESRRIDNQLRGRAGRQGDPGSSRFYLSLQDDLLRIFGGETMAAWMQTLGMEEGQAIESKLLTRRIEGCQKKVEEKNFDIRKNLLDYDEVMDVQRKRVYGFRQSILSGENTKLIILDMLRRQVERCVKDCLNEDYGPASFARFASQRLGCEFEASDFRRCDFEEACRVAREQAMKQALTSLEDAVEENLSAEDPRDWNWEALSNFLQRQFNIKCSVKELKQIGREHIVSEMLPRAEKYLEQVDLSDGAPALEPDFGLKSIADWCLLKFRVKVDPTGLAHKSAKEIVDLLMADVQTLYRQKEIEFPVQVGLANFMAEHDGGGQRYNRQGLLDWARVRFNGKADHLNETTFLIESRSRLRDMLLEISRAYFPVAILEKMEELLDRCFRTPTARLSSEQAGELAAWASATLQAPLTAAELQGKDERSARSLLQNAFDERYRPEMRSMERSLLLHVIDSKWMAHLYTMDHLRAGVGLVSYAQIDPKIEYKRQGMKAFDEMWETVDSEVTDLIFRMEEEAGTVQVTQSAARHEAAQSALQAPPPDANEMRGNTSEAPKKVDPFRNKGPKVGRNDPCPCGSGKKHKNCCMKK